MSDQPESMPPQIANIHKATIGNIEFSKKQQWATTNYTVAIYAGIFGLAKSLGTISTLERSALTALAVVTFGCATALLIQIQDDLGTYRTRLEKIHNHWLSENDKKVIGVEPYVNPALRGSVVLGGLGWSRRNRRRDRHLFFMALELARIRCLPHSVIMSRLRASPAASPDFPVNRFGKLHVEVGDLDAIREQDQVQAARSRAGTISPSKPKKKAASPMACVRV